MPTIELVPWAYGAGAYYRGLNALLLASLPHSFARARPARTPAARSQVRIHSVERVTMDARGRLGKNRARGHAPHVVDYLRNRLKMIWKYATLVAAKMVDLESGRNCPYALLIDPTVRVNLPSHEPENRVPNIVASSGPNDAVARHRHLVPKSTERLELFPAHSFYPCLGTV